MPGYTQGLPGSALVFALNKRFVPDRSTGLFDCGPDFHLANNPNQWVADYSEFISSQLNFLTVKPRKVLLVGVSEAAIATVKVAGLTPEVTHLAIIGSGGYSMRQSLTTLKEKGAIGFDVNEGWKKISSAPESIADSWYGNTHLWWTAIMDLDPVRDYLQLNIPIFVAMGEKDESVPVESGRFLADKFNALGKHNLILKIYPGADHRLLAHGTSRRTEFFTELSRRLNAN